MEYGEGDNELLTYGTGVPQPGGLGMGAEFLHTGHSLSWVISLLYPMKGEGNGVRRALS
ncbi:hypothetical protein BACI349Y_50178 [Bacillus sp. 349Y]|nr:hypothetical protein BACI349Y_50178 [Bacillus sp. 349Y]